MKKLLLLVTALLVACKKPAPPAELPPPPPPPAAAEAPKPPPKVVTRMAENFKRVNFEYDSATLTSSSKSYLEENARLMSSNPEIKLTVQGHCDERGSTSYNMALGSRRADTVKKYLIAQGVPASRVSTVSYGEERPLQNDENEVAWAENRRAEFAITWTGSSDNKDYVRGTVD